MPPYNSTEIAVILAAVGVAVLAGWLLSRPAPKGPFMSATHVVVTHALTPELTGQLNRLIAALNRPAPPAEVLTPAPPLTREPTEVLAAFEKLDLSKVSRPEPSPPADPPVS